MPDLSTVQCTVAANGTITVVSKHFMNQAQVAAVAAGVSTSVSTITTGTDWIQVSTAIVNTTPQTQAAAERNTFVGSNQNPQYRGTVTA